MNGPLIQLIGAGQMKDYNRKDVKFIGVLILTTMTDKELENAAWYYPDTKEKANHIKDYVAFYKNKVDITSEE